MSEVEMSIETKTCHREENSINKRRGKNNGFVNGKNNGLVNCKKEKRKALSYPHFAVNLILYMQDIML